MSPLRKVAILTSSALLILVAMTSSRALAVSNIDPGAIEQKYGWGENAGWVNLFGDGTNGVRVASHFLSGFAWLENVGWVNFGNGAPAGAENRYTNSSATDFGVNNDGAGHLSGYAWGENVGWIVFDTTGSGGSRVTISPSTGVFSGYAWGENIGWISFSDVALADVAKTDPSVVATSFTQLLDDNTTLSSGWSQFGTTTSTQTTGYDSGETALLAHIGADTNGYRIIGWLSNATNTMYYSSVGTSNFVRAKYYIYAAGQSGTAVNQIPNFRIRVANRFAVSSILLVSNHLNADPEATKLSLDVRPSTAPASPSLYRVDLDPVDVPQLTSHPSTEGFLRIFEAYEPDPQANGDLGMTECIVGVYPALSDTTTTVPVTQNGLLKSYRTNASGGGDFGTGIIASSNSVKTIAKYHNGVVEATGPQPSITITSAGITLETLSVESDRIGTAAFDVFNDPGDQTNHLTRARVEAGKQYKLRFHATSTLASNIQALVRFRARTIKFQYTTSLEVGGSTGASVASNTIAAQALPGVGNQIPAFDRINPTEHGGWYNVVITTPMNPDIQASQPNLAAQDPPGVDTVPGNNSKSRRDLQFGFDVIDTFSQQPNSGTEIGQMTVDRVDIEKYDLVPD